VAVKTVKKANMKHDDIVQQIREIEILKFSKHTNIVKLLDIFENNEYYFMVLEYMGGSNLYEYLSQYDFNLSEERIKNIAYQLC
jgi:serine/threonine protein kinase